MHTELKDFVVNLKSLSQDIEDPIIQGGGDTNGRALRIIFTQEAADMFTPDTKVYLYWNHQQLKTYGVNVFTRVSKNECCFNPPVWEIHWPKAMLHEGDVLCCIKLVDDVSISPSNNFLVHVLQDPNDGSSFVVGDDYSVFDKCILEMNSLTDKLRKEFEGYQKEFEEMRQSFTTIQDNSDKAKGRVDTLEGEMDAAQASITTIAGEGEGSIKKAASDALTSAKSYTDQEVAKKANLKHTHTTAQVDGLDTALAGKANKATTLAGYGISDAYTKGEADSAIAVAVAAAPHLKRTIVEDLPDAKGADENTIYMVGTGAGSEDSAYEEYMVINGAFEKMGSSKVDLTNYAEKTYVDAAEQNAKTYADGLIAGLDVKDSAQSGKYVSAVSQENGVITVQRAALPAAPKITTGSANGTIAVSGEDVAVKGLGSAAYTETSAYATAAQGTKADQVFAALTWQEG